MAEHSFHGSRRRPSVVGSLFTGLPTQTAGSRQDPRTAVEKSKEEEEEVGGSEVAPLQKSSEGIPPAPHQTSEGVHLRWTDLSYDVPDGDGGTKRILHTLAGSVSPGDCMAIMGPSGCGKSSLLNILAHRRSGEEEGICGRLEINGKPINIAEFRRLSGFVSQDFVSQEFFVPGLCEPRLCEPGLCEPGVF